MGANIASVAFEIAVVYCHKMITFTAPFLLAFFLMCTTLPVSAADLFIMAEEYPPYSYTENGQASGLMVDIVRQIQERLGRKKSEIHFYPWARSYKKLQNGTGEVLFPMAMTPERSTMFKFVGPIFWDDVYFYCKKGHRIKIDSVSDAKTAGLIAVTRDDIYHQNLVSMGFTNLDVSASYKSDVLKLVKGRVDLLPVGIKALPYFVQGLPELNIDDLERTGPPIFLPLRI